MRSRIKNESKKSYSNRVKTDQTSSVNNTVEWVAVHTVLPYANIPRGFGVNWAISPLLDLKINRSTALIM